MIKANPKKYQDFKNFKILFIAKLILANMLLAGILIYLFELYEFRNYYLTIILCAYALKVFVVNTIAILASISGSCFR